MNKLIFIIFIFISLFLFTGCVSGGLKNGAIKGKLYVYEGNQPALEPIKVRVEAHPHNSGDTALERAKFRYTIIEPKGHGEYIIEDVPVGEYEVVFNIQGKVAGVAYLIGLGNQPPAEGEESPQSSDSVNIAYVESGRVYKMPDFYIVKWKEKGVGTLKGKAVYSSKHIPLKGIVVKVGGKTATTNEEGEFTISEIPAGEQQVEFLNNIYVTQDNTIIIPKDGYVEKTFIMSLSDHVSTAKVRGLVEIPSEYLPWIQPSDVIGFTETSSGEEQTIDISDGFYFSTSVLPYISQYRLHLSLKEPYFYNTSIYTIPALQPGEVHEVPDNAISLEPSHKTVTVRIFPPEGESIVSGRNVLLKVEYNSNAKTFIVPPASNCYMTSIDLLYGLPAFSTTNVTAINENWKEIEDIEIEVSENSSDVINLYIGSAGEGGGTGG